MIKKYFYTIVILLLSVSFVNAQRDLSTGTYVDNFSMVDINGKEHALYDYLDQGKKVILYFTTTYNETSAFYVFGDIFPKFWDLYGPAGTDEYMVFLIETDSTTTVEDIKGEGENTLMDWTAFGNFPIFNTDTLNQYFDVRLDRMSYYIVCQNRMLISLLDRGYAQIYEKGKECPLPEFSLDAQLESVSIPGGLTCSSNYHPKIVFSNQGSETLTSANLEVSIDGAPLETIKWEGSLPVYYETEIELPVQTDLTKMEHLVNARITNPNGNIDDNTANNEINTGFKNNPGGAALTLSVLSDPFPLETHFKIKKGDSLVYETTFDNGEVFSLESICLNPDECYTLEIIDDGFDGFDGFAGGLLGECHLIYKKDTLLSVLGDEFDYSIESEFCMPTLQSGTDIIAFSYNNIDATIDEINKEVKLKLPVGTNLTELAPVFELSKYAMAYYNGIEQISGVSKNDFSQVVNYIIIAENGDDQLWKINIEIASNISENLNKAVEAYPNPTTNIISLKGIEGSCTAKIYSIDGKMLKKLNIESNKTIDVSDLETGQYFIRIITKLGLTESIKFIKN